MGSWVDEAEPFHIGGGNRATRHRDCNADSYILTKTKDIFFTVLFYTRCILFSFEGWVKKFSSSRGLSASIYPGISAPEKGDNTNENNYAAFFSI